jgi:hypothetical protein
VDESFQGRLRSWMSEVFLFQLASFLGHRFGDFQPRGDAAVCNPPNGVYGHSMGPAMPLPFYHSLGHLSRKGRGFLDLLCRFRPSDLGQFITRGIVHCLSCCHTETSEFHASSLRILSVALLVPPPLHSPSDPLFLLLGRRL